MVKTKVYTPEVLFADEPVVKLGSGDIGDLKNRMAESGGQKIRLCAHQNISEPLHEMMIVHKRGAYVHPHLHMNKTESFHIVEGSADVVIFSDTGEMVELIRMGDYASGLVFYYRVSSGIYHTVLVRSEILVFHETTKGPFNSEETLYAAWAPDGTDQVGIDEYMHGLSRIIAGGKSSR